MTKEQKLFAYWMTITCLIGFLAFACTYTPEAKCNWCTGTRCTPSPAPNTCGYNCICVRSSPNDNWGFCASL